jgi:hypothetical protein
LHYTQADAAIGAVHHQVHRTLEAQHGSQRFQTYKRIGKVVQHPGAVDQVEAFLELSNLLDREFH